MQVVSSTGTTTLTAAIASTGATAVSVAASQNLAPGVVIQVDSELMQVTAVTGLNLTVTRAYNGTAAATHANNATVTILACVFVATLINSTTLQAAAALAVTFNQIRIDGTVLSGGGATAFTTDSWGRGMLFQSLSAGPHVVEVQTSTTLPWVESCFYVGPIGQTALTNAGLMLQVAGNVASGTTSDSTHITTNLPYPANATMLEGQVVTFTSGVLAGQSFIVDGAMRVGSGSLKLAVSPGWTANPAAGDAFTLSNVATAYAMESQISSIPEMLLPSIIDPVNGDGSALVTNNGQVNLNPAAMLAALVNAGVLQLVAGSTTLYQLTETALVETPILSIQTVESFGRC